MREVDRSALLPYSAETMFDLVNDVARYPEFLPWCSNARVVESTPNSMLARIDISMSGLSKSFSTRNTLTPPERIDMQLADGPFKSLVGGWHFEALREDACKVTLHLEFEFSNPVMSMVFGPVFNSICESMLDAFVSRAKALHG